MRLFFNISIEIILSLLLLSIGINVLLTVNQETVALEGLILNLTQTFLPLICAFIAYMYLFKEVAFTHNKHKVEKNVLNLNLFRTLNIVQFALFMIFFFNFKKINFEYNLFTSITLFFLSFLISYSTITLFISFLDKNFRSKHASEEFISKNDGNKFILPMLPAVLYSLLFSGYLAFFDLGTFNLTESIKDIPIITYFVFAQISGIVVSYIFFSNNFFEKRNLIKKN